MIVQVVETKLQKKECIKYIKNKTPLMSKVFQFNKTIKDINVNYIEFKVIKYELTSKSKTSNMFKSEIKKEEIIMIVNTQTGYSESIQIVPETKPRYISKSLIKKSKMKEEDIINNVKEYIIRHLSSKEDLKNITVQSINLKEIYSIYKPYWVGMYNERKIMIKA